MWKVETSWGEVSSTSFAVSYTSGGERRVVILPMSTGEAGERGTGCSTLGIDLGGGLVVDRERALTFDAFSHLAT